MSAVLSSRPLWLTDSSSTSQLLPPVGQLADHAATVKTSQPLFSALDSAGLHDEAFVRFCQPVSAITAVAPAMVDVFSESLRLLRAAHAARSSTSMDEESRVVDAALSVARTLDSRGESRAAAREIMSFVEDCLWFRAIYEPNQLLMKADIDTMSSRTLIGLIRSTYVARKRLPAWNRAYAKAWLRAKQLGVAPEALFVGMPKPHIDAAHAG
ncbi:hypothetical protein JJB11_12285 [Ramlibacter ginsenosidimutans]|uniref:Uncharacterized protein n=1 Tax=Ramlibacter ginsenosidimutans TaxID=502333 RepID=A0A934TTA2_9BURK|nr:hypothetical protein [Ramlibacter ginsenosidimutans]MBK6006870.1 hypothetical protein [Ramlibacter ginsenosidimutans]